MNYYNEFDPYCAQWLRNLINAGHIPLGDVDERSIAEVRPQDVKRYTQCHFFAGIGGWSYALKLAGWPESKAVWTGSCPCQPFSAAGKQKGANDERHLWPEFYRLIRECKPDVVFGEQVEGAIKHGWLDLVQADLEGSGYAVGAACIPACGVGAPHRRQRLWWVSDDNAPGRSIERRSQLLDRERQAQRHDADGCGEDGILGDTLRERSQGRERSHDVELQGAARPSRSTSEASVPGAWSDIEWLACTDGKARPTQSGLFPLAHGIPGRVGRLRAYGNAIVPQVAAEFIQAYLECRP